jgi:hypothetical protein
MKIKKITYIDSTIGSEQATDIIKPIVIQAVGWVIKETDEYVTIAQELMENGDYRGQLSIPKKAICH